MGGRTGVAGVLLASRSHGFERMVRRRTSSGELLSPVSYSLLAGRGGVRESFHAGFFGPSSAWGVVLQKPAKCLLSSAFLEGEAMFSLFSSSAVRL